METEYVALTVALLVVLSLGGMMALNSAVIDREQALALSWVERDQALAETYWLRIAALPPAYQIPVDGPISSETGYRTDPMGGTTESLHQGIDVVGKIGTPVKAALAGRVAEHWPPPGTPIPGKPGQYYKGHDIYGGYVVLDHGDGLLSRYGHLSVTKVHTGQWVEAGEEIGAIGDTGISTGPHLHWEVVIDPLRYLGERR